MQAPDEDGDAAATDAALFAVCAGTYLFRTRSAVYLWTRDKADIAAVPPAELLNQVDAAQQIVLTAQRILWGGEAEDCRLQEPALLERIAGHIEILIKGESQADGSDSME